MKMTSSTWFIDLSNVMGSVPDGWWRDREGATRRLIADIRAWADSEVIVVLDAGPDDLLGTDHGVTVVRAPRRGRNAADDEIVRRLDGIENARVVTSDATLVARVRELGAEVEGAKTFRRRLASPR